MKKFCAAGLFLPIIILFTWFHEGVAQSSCDSTWLILFDGTSMDAWRGYKLDTVPGNWTIREGVLQADGTKGDLITRQQFVDFELVFQWRISKGGNSGVFYHVKEGPEYPMVWHTGIEMQIMDNANNPLAKNAKRGAASLYDMYAPIHDATNPAGEWNTSRLIVKNRKVEYWVNQELVNQYDLWTDKWYADREQCIHNNNRKPFWGEFIRGHISLQDEGFRVAYRNIKIRELTYK